MTDQTLRLGRLTRSAPVIEARAIDTEARTVDLVFSSEAPVERWFGLEILGHGAGEVDLERQARGVLPLLINHDRNRQIGAVIAARVEGGRGVATVKFSRSAAAEEVFQDVLDGLRDGVSVGYVVHQLRLESDENDVKTYRVTRWEPLEISLASIPADASVGVGRDADGEGVRDVPVEAGALASSTTEGGDAPETSTQETTEVRSMPDGNNAPAPAAPASPAPADRAAIDTAIAARNREIADIVALGARHNRRDLADQAIRDGRTLPEFRGVLLEALGDQTQLETPASAIGASDREVRRFSLIRAVDALVRRDWSNAGVEREMVEAAQAGVIRAGGTAARGFYLPHEYLARDLSAGGAGTGAELVGTVHAAGSFIELLRNRMMVRRLGARVLSGLVGDIAIPKQTGGATAYWLSSETATVTESTPATGTVSLTPKHVAGRVDITRQMRLQSDPSVDALVRDDLANVLALAADAAAINGSGASGQPTGILNVSGIGDVAGGTNGLAPTWSHMVGLETDVSVANAAMGSLAYLTNAKVRGKLKETEKFTGGGKEVWDTPAGMEPGFGMVNGYQAGVTNQVPDNLDKGTSTGVCSAVIFGNWADLLIAEWGVLDITADPYTSGDNGSLIMRAFQSLDLAPRHAGSFAAMQDALTA